MGVLSKVRKTAIVGVCAVFAATAVIGVAAAVDYGFAVHQKSKARFLKRNKCFVSYGAHGPLKSVALNYAIIASQLAGKDATYRVAAYFKGDVKGSFANLVLNNRQYGIRRCYDMPVSGQILSYLTGVPAPKVDLLQ